MAVQERQGPPPDPTAIFEAARGYQLSYILRAAVELDVFTAIAKGSRTAAELAKACQASERGIRILCDSLTVMGLLDKHGNAYSLKPDAAFFLDRRSPAYLGGAFKFLLHPRNVENMRTLAETVRRGGAAGTDAAFAPDDPIWVDFARGMAPLMRPAAQAIAKILQPALAGKAAPKVLDIAAGHGTFGITVAQQIPGAQIYALDWANVLAVATENAQAHGVGDRHHVLPGSAFEVDFGSGYDAALVTNFLHHFDPATNESLLRRIHHAMNPGGQLIILEFVPNEDRVSPPTPAIFSVTMLSNTLSGDAYTFPELEKMCANSGFEGARLIALSPMPQTLVVARKG
ncbi:MAG TPA: class I SAM-dependent methyltransferase [Gemmataceae bacterium]|nr:class I SAM-dependent methyltransferase [Gemmataceae bacterium]